MKIAGADLFFKHTNSLQALGLSSCRIENLKRESSVAQHEGSIEFAKMKALL